MASEMHGKAEVEACTQVDSFAGKARQEREHEVEIRREHAEWYPEERPHINQYIETYRWHDKQDKDMSDPIGNAKRQL